MYKRQPFLKFNAGVFSLSKYKIVSSSFKKFTECDGGQCLSAKGMLHTRIQLPSGVEVDVFNTHLQAFKTAVEIRKTQVEEILSHMKKVNDGRRAVILVGDFNISAKREEYTSLIARLAQEGFRDSWVELNGADQGYTWDSYINNWGAEGIDSDGKSQHRFDYIFVKNGTMQEIELESSKIIFDQPLGLSEKSEKYFLSDHFGVELNLKIKNK